MKAWRSREVNPVTGKRGVTFNSKYGYLDMPVQIPCGQCVGCRLERSRQWAIRCLHEMAMHDDNCFITLTYRNEDLPEDGSLNVRHYQLFMKRLRSNHRDKRIRFFHCGEYGEENWRPHYHAILFGIDFEDKVPWKEINGNIVYTSKELEDTWSLGFCSLGAANFSSAAYVARYIMKKVNGAAAASHYEYVQPLTGEIICLKPEYVTMSRRPGIGKTWYQKYSESDIHNKDYVVVNGKKMKPPKYYDRILEEENARQIMIIKGIRKREARKHEDNNTPDRLKVREQVQLARLNQLPRE